MGKKIYPKEFQDGNEMRMELGGIGNSIPIISYPVIPRDGFVFMDIFHGYFSMDIFFLWIPSRIPLNPPGKSFPIPKLKAGKRWEWECWLCWECWEFFPVFLFFPPIPSLGAVSEVTAAGVIGTGTHNTGIQLGILPTQVGSWPEILRILGMHRSHPKMWIWRREIQEIFQRNSGWWNFLGWDFSSFPTITIPGILLLWNSTGNSQSQKKFLLFSVKKSQKFSVSPFFSP